jgi:predicted Zn-dependent protease
MSLATGTRLGTYEIQSALGAGGMGEVYRAIDTRLKREVAIKVLPESLAANADRLARFQREAEVLAQLNHPNIASIHGLEEVAASPSRPGMHALVMELVEGPTLEERIARGDLGVDEALRIASQIARALEASHDKGIVHRDLKPANIKLRPDGVVKVLDFGLARVMNEARDSGVSRAPTEVASGTAAGIVMGTASYMSPEQARGVPVDKATDVWAFGCVVYEMLARTRAFGGETFSESIARVLEREPDWTALPGATPPQVRDVLRRCLAKDVQQRLRDIRDVRLQLEDQRPRSRRAALIVASAAALLLFVAGGLWIGLQNRNHATETSAANATGRRVSTGAPASDNQEANEAFELAIQLSNVQNDVQRAQTLLERALTLDPRFAEALRYHATNYAFILLNGYSNDTSQLYKAEDELRQVSLIAPDLPSLPAAWVTVYLTQGRKELIPWGDLDRALKREPSHVNNRFWRGMALWLAGDNTAAQQEFRTILADQPLFGPGRMFLGETLRNEGRVQEAIREIEKVLEQAPDNISAVQMLTLAYLDHGEVARARMLLEDKRSRFSTNYLWRALWALALAAEGHREEALRAIDQDTLTFAGAAFPSTLVVAELYALVGDSSRAIEWLQRTVRNGDERTDWFRRNPRLSSVREDPRFTRIIESVESRRKQAAPR